MPAPPPDLVMPPRRLRPQERYGLEAGVLVHRTGRREQRWPLVALRKVVVGVRRSPYAPPLRFIRLMFGRPGLGGRILTIACGPGPGYAAFVRALAQAAAAHAPQARFETQGGRLTGALTGLALLLGAGALAMGAAAIMAGLEPLGLDLCARLVFLLILIVALWPWIARSGPRPLDPLALPGALIDL